MTDTNTPIIPIDYTSPIEFRNVFSLLVHAASKVGKSTLAATSPAPRLVLDAEGSWKFIRTRKTYWNPVQGPPPRNDGTWDTCIVDVQDWDTVVRVYQWLTQSPHDFISVVMDSITEIQSRCKANLRGTEQMRIQDWGAILTYMDNIIRAYRDLTTQPNPIRCVVFIAETKKDDNGKWVPFMQGQIARSLPYRVDICAILFTNKENDANGQPTLRVRHLLISADSDAPYEVGERVQGTLPDIIREPNLTDMLSTIYAEAQI